jgi:genome maintenance exonuclease 1
LIFKHDFWSFNDLNTDESTGERHYILPDGSAVPSVTTVLSRLSKDGIDKWKARVGEEEAKRISTQAAKRGTAIHSICEQYLLNNPEYKKGVMPINLDTFRRMKPYLDNYVGTIHGLEVPLYSYELQTAGRTDCIAEYRNKLSIIDFKTSRKPKKEAWIQNYFIQATCYSIMAEALFGIAIPQIVIIIAVDNEDPQVFRKDKAKYVERVREVFGQAA